MRRNAKSERVTQREKTKKDKRQLLIMQRKRRRKKSLVKSFKEGC
jgi:hypothetical protein